MPTEITNLSNFQVATRASPRPSPSARATTEAAAPDTRQILPGGNADTPPSTLQTAAPAAEEVSAQELAQAVERINSHIQNLQRSLQFSVDEELGRTVVKVLDSETEEVIRQIPSEEVLTIARNIRDMTVDNQSGSLFFEERA